MHPKPAEWTQFYASVLRKTGIDLGQYKAQQLQRRIIGMMDSKEMSDLEGFYAWIAGSKQNETWFLDRLAINVSELFRNREKWVELEKKVLPELIERSASLKAWSAGCSYGAEAYSLASLLVARFPGRHQIIGTDIDQAALDQARRGAFGDTDMRCVPNDLKDRFFTRIDGEWRASQDLKRLVEFRTGNLLAERFESGFDLIMCRNVVIYFNDDAKDRLYKRFFQALKPGGYLLVGSTERIFKSKEIGYECPIPFFYRKPISGDQLWRNAS